MAEEDGQILIKNHQKKTKTEENGDWSSRFPCIGDNLCDGGSIDIVENRVKKRKRRKKLDKEEEDKFTVEKGHDLPIESVKKQDPLVVLGYDIMLMIFGYLDARSVVLSLLASCRWHGVACSDRLWAPKVSFFFVFSFLLSFSGEESRNNFDKVLIFTKILQDFSVGWF